jgi:outer membrane lipoprotein carrier protein
VPGPAASARKTFRGRRKYVLVGCGRGVLPLRPPKALFCARLCGLVLTLTTVVAAATAAGTPLDSYLDELKTLRATFVQTVTDAHGNEIDRATGTLIVSRPGKFSWEIHPERSGSRAGQLMVCDGVNLWFLDRDLEQVTVKPVDAALSATPAMLLSGVTEVRKSFSITPAGRRAGLEWVLVEPRDAEADFRRALFGFAGRELKRMILEDKLGETTTISFGKIERNVPVAPSEVSFTPPAGADVIGTPRQ